LKGKKFSKDRRLRLSLSHKGKPNPNKGKHGLFTHTEEAKQRIRQSSLGRKYPNRKKVTEETKLKLSLKSKGRKHSEEAKEKIRNFCLGRKRPEMTGKNNPMHKHPNAYKSKFGKTGYRKDLGVFVKSSWEANVFRIYRYLGYTVQYEPKSFKLSSGKTYRPDFYIIELDLWIEVKGRWLKDAYERFLNFKQEYSTLFIQVIGPDKYKEMIKKYKSLIYLEG